MFYDDLTVAIVDSIIRDVWVKENEINLILKIESQKQIKGRLALLHAHGLISKYCTRCKEATCACGSRRRRRRPEDGEVIDEKFDICYFNYDDFYTSVKCRLYYLEQDFSTNTHEKVPLYQCLSCVKEFLMTHLKYNGDFVCPDCSSNVMKVQSGQDQGSKDRKRYSTQVLELKELLDSLRDEKRANNYPLDEDHEAAFHQLMGLRRRGIDRYEMTDAKRRRRITKNLAQENKIAVLFSDEEDEDGKVSLHLAKGMTFAEAVEARDEEEKNESSKTKDEEDALAELREKIPWFLTKSSVTGEKDFNLVDVRGSSIKQRDVKSVSASSKMSKNEEAATIAKERREAYLKKYENGDIEIFPECWGEHLSEMHNKGWKLWRDDYQQTRGAAEGEELDEAAR